MIRWLVICRRTNSYLEKEENKEPLELKRGITLSRNRTFHLILQQPAVALLDSSVLLLLDAFVVDRSNVGDDHRRFLRRGRRRIAVLFDIRYAFVDTEQLKCSSGSVEHVEIVEPEKRR